MERTVSLISLFFIALFLSTTTQIIKYKKDNKLEIKVGDYILSFFSLIMIILWSYCYNKFVVNKFELGEGIIIGGLIALSAHLLSIKIVDKMYKSSQ